MRLIKKKGDVLLLERRVLAALFFYTSFYLSKGDWQNAKKALDKASSYVGNSLVEEDYAIDTYLAVKARYYKAVEISCWHCVI